MEKFYQLLAKQVSVVDFEQWVYSTPEVESVLKEEDYLALIALNYKAPSAFYELQKLLSGYVNWSEVRRRELLEVLETIANGSTPDDVLAALLKTYDWYCRGYFFLESIAFSFLSAEIDFAWDPEGKWGKLTERQKQQYSSRFYPEAKRLAQQLIQQLESGRIQLHILGPEDEISYTETSVTAAIQGLDLSETAAPSVKPWWQLWK